MPNLEYTLERLALTFTARDIMVPKEKLVCTSDEASAQRLVEEKPDFDVIPIEQNGRISAYLERGFKRSKPIRLQDITSDATNILDLLDILQEQKFAFILANRCIAGYVHFSDMNNHIVKLPFFVILEALERRLVEEVGPLINEGNLEVVLDPQRAEKVKDKMRRMKENRADLGWVNVLSFNEVVRFACHFEKVALEPQQVEVISKVRNLVCHADRPLVEAHRDVRRLAEAKKICISVLKGMTV